MDFKVVRRVRDGLAELIGVVNSGAVSTVDARRVLSESKAFAAQVAVLQADAAALVAAGERHGDGGAGVLAEAAGLSRRDAVGQVRAVGQLQSMPRVRDAVTEGEISLANAKTLARASEQITADQVERDHALLEKAASLSPERFARETGRWVAQRQDDGGEARYRRQRARRRLSFWDGDDGDRVQQQGRATVERPSTAAAHQSPDGRAGGALRCLRGLRRALRGVPGPPHTTQIPGRAHQHRQLDAVVLGMPRQSPPPRLASRAQRRPVHHQTPRAHPTRPRPSPRPTPKQQPTPPHRARRPASSARAP